MNMQTIVEAILKTALGFVSFTGALWLIVGLAAFFEAERIIDNVGVSGFLVTIGAWLIVGACAVIYALYRIGDAIWEDFSK